MRELKDYFCTYEQSKALMSLDCQYRWVVARYENDNDNILVLLLRSQALDYFRELGYKIVINQNERGHWYEIEKYGILRTQGGWLAYEFAESKAISLLIELEKEARNGK